MCGLTGWFDFRRQCQRQDLERMTAALHHRGPDSDGYFVENGLALGFRRLAIIDLVTGDQPLFSEDERLVLVCNGEIYNYRELAAELVAKGHTFRTRSDVEVLLHLYEEHGVAMLERLNGQFSFALYDRAARQLLLARDPFGINPMFYAEVGGTLFFGSEIKAILEHPQVSREVDLTGLDQVLTFPGLVGSRTLFAGIRCLEAGHFLRVSATGLEDREYWDLVYPTQNEAASSADESFYVDGLRDRLEQAVRYRLQADVPVGFYLSGGVDSSLIGALIAQATGGNPGRSFSISFTDEEISEARYQRLMAERLGSEHHEIRFDWREIS
ncbi:MAG: asparagine synthase (glutamine-hydrolyzing), partial [Pseudomonadota bacterium]